MKRSDLKKLVKECLVEILQEGLAGSIGDTGVPLQIIDDVRPRAKAQARPKKRRRSLRDAVMETKNPPQRRRRPGPSQHPGLDVAVQRPSPLNEAVASVTSDPMMAGIFADTANTTMRRQAAAGHSGPSRNNPQAEFVPSGGDMAGMVVAMNEPEDLFEGVGNWASLAFPEGPEKGLVPPNPHALPAPKAQDPMLDQPASEVVRTHVHSTPPLPAVGYDPYADPLKDPSLVR